MHTNYLPHIDGLRAFAVLSVLIFHISPEVLPGGFVGVDIFFVISGFLITRLIKAEFDATKRFEFKRFYIRRFKRLYPALVVVVLLTFILAVFTMSPAGLQRLGGTVISSLLSVSNLFFWFEADYFDTASQFKPLLHTWSLSVEEQFYLFWPILLLFTYRYLYRFSSFVFASVFFLSFWLNFEFSGGRPDWLGSVFLGLESLENGKSTIFFNLPFRIFEFGFGCFLALNARSVPQNSFLQDFFLLVGVLLIVASFLFTHEELIFPSYYALFPCFGAALVIWIGGHAKLGKFLSNQHLVWIGLISYSLYLVHWPLIVFYKYTFGEIELLSGIAIFCVSIALAFICNRLIEKPFRYASFDYKFSLVIFLPVLALFVSGLTSYFGNGWAFRSPVKLEVVEDPKDYHRKFYGGASYPRYGGVNTDKPVDILLMGDSHGRHYAEGLYNIVALEEGLSLYIAAGTSCLHLPRFTRTTTGADWDVLCPDAFSKAIRIIESVEEPPLIVISHLWLYQMLNGDLLSKTGEREYVDLNKKNLVDGILALSERVGREKVIVIGQVPTTGGIDLYDAFTRPRTLSGFFNELEDYSKSKVEGYLVKFRDFNDEFGKLLKQEGVTFINPFDFLCSGNVCRNLDEEGRLIYSDPEHLSKHGSHFLVNKIKDNLITLLVDKK